MEESSVIVMEMSFEEIVKALEGKVIVDNYYKNFNKFCIDNRKIEKDNIFLAIKGEKFNANNVAIKALEDGASIAIVDEVNFDLNVMI